MNRIISKAKQINTYKNKNTVFYTRDITAPVHVVHADRPSVRSTPVLACCEQRSRLF